MGIGCVVIFFNFVVCGESIFLRRKRNCWSCNCSCSGVDYEVVCLWFDVGDGVNDWVYWLVGVFDLVFGVEGIGIKRWIWKELRDFRG